MTSYGLPISAGIPSRASGGIGLLLAFAFSLYPLYYQSHLNGLWDRYLQGPSMPLPHALPPPARPPPMA
jgi:hypothetical protein